MNLGKVIGTVWSTRKDENLVGAKFLIVKELDLEYKPKNNFVVAVDSVGAGVGEIVLFAQGSSARQTAFTKNKPVDAVIMAIVDKLDVSVKDKIKELEEDK
ncbi:MAG: EutN/CcmL family microcompartment protein [Ignavibacteriae bacterium]|nr:ethanolamine utilization protein EutN [Ignavibacteriota bacterium]NOG97604.1 EutN/CcmL family microcompartment protein [Ignavibacteriota bacterium]